VPLSFAPPTPFKKKQKKQRTYETCDCDCAALVCASNAILAICLGFRLGFGLFSHTV